MASRTPVKKVPIHLQVIDVFTKFKFLTIKHQWFIFDAIYWHNLWTSVGYSVHAMAAKNSESILSTVVPVVIHQFCMLYRTCYSACLSDLLFCMFRLISSKVLRAIFLFQSTNTNSYWCDM